MRIIGIVPGAKLFGSEDLYADQYLFVNGYPKRILANGATPIGILSSDGYAAQDSLALCDAFVFCGGARFYPYHFQIMEYAAKSGKPVLGICLGMQMMNTYFLVAEEAERRGWDRPLLALFEQMKKERYMFTEPVDGHWDGHITRDNVERFKHPVHVTPGSRLERLTGKQTIMGASMHNYRITHPAQSLCVAGRTDDGTIEALEYGEQMLGVQFHPEADDQNDDLFRAVRFRPCLCHKSAAAYNSYMRMMVSAISRFLTQRSIAAFSIQRCASCSVMPSCRMRSPFAFWMRLRS